MSTFLSYLAAVIATLALFYFIYARVKKAQSRRDTIELGVGGRSTGPGRRVRR